MHSPFGNPNSPRRTHQIGRNRRRHCSPNHYTYSCVIEHGGGHPPTPHNESSTVYIMTVTMGVIKSACSSRKSFRSTIHLTPEESAQNKICPVLHQAITPGCLRVFCRCCCSRCNNSPGDVGIRPFMPSPRYAHI
jgi:hypothetical protein